MTKYEVIKKIMENDEFDEECKVFKIELYLKGWLSEKKAINGLNYVEEETEE